MGEAETKISSVKAFGAVSGGSRLGDEIHFFLAARRAGGEGAVDASYTGIGADEGEAYVVHLRDGRRMSGSSRKNHLAVLRGFLQTVSRRMRLAEPPSTRRASTRPAAAFRLDFPAGSRVARRGVGSLRRGRRFSIHPYGIGLPAPALRFALSRSAITKS